MQASVHTSRSQISTAMRRWRFADPARQADQRYLQNTHRKIRAWWREFASKTQMLHELFTTDTDWDIESWMHKHLHAIHEDLMWEFGSATTGKGHRLVITPESRHQLRPLVETVLQMAPEISGWEFCGERRAETFSRGKDLIEAKTGGNLQGVEVSVSINEQRKIDLIYFSPEFNQRTDGGAMETAYLATETLLGEATLDHWIGAIDIQPKRRENKSHFSLLSSPTDAEALPRIPVSQLAATIQELQSELTDGLPKAPCIDLIATSTWNIWEPAEAPSPKQDYPGREDLIMHTSCFPEVMSSTFEYAPFFSCCFSRFNETFAYLKIDGAEGLAEKEGFTDRAEIEDALAHELLSDRLGCVIGGGTGLRYSYIELALLDMDQALPKLLHTLRQGKLPLRSWLLFHDAVLAAEWIGVYQDSPPPPGLH